MTHVSQGRPPIRAKVLVALFAFMLTWAVGLAASEHAGQITFAGLPLPGATVTAVQGDRKLTTVSDQEGRYRFADLADGVWQVRVEMLGFETQTSDVTVAAQGAPGAWPLKLLAFEDITRNRDVQRVDTASNAPSPSAASSAANNRPAAAGGRGANPSANANAAAGRGSNPAGAPPPAAAESPEAAQAADGLLINGSVNNGAASPFAQAAAFGNNRRGGRSLYTGSLGMVLGNSAFDARPYSFTSQKAPRPDYNDVQMLGTIGGPLRIPHLIRNGPTFFVGYQHNIDNSTTTQSALVPTALERRGDFSQSINGSGGPLVIVDPRTGQPFTDNAIPADLIAPQASSLLNYYPFPNLDAGGSFNYQRPVITTTKQDNAQVRLNQSINPRNQLSGTLGLARTDTTFDNVFGLPDRSLVTTISASVNWNRRFSQMLSMRATYTLTRFSTHVTPFFAGRINVSGIAGINGNDQTAENWGPPSLVFSSGLAGFGSTQFADNTNTTHGWTGELLNTRGRHSLTMGAVVRLQHVDVISQQDARGTFGFTGTATGSPLADFMVGLPHTSTIAFGNADKFLRASGYDVYFNDDWRVSPALTLNAGVRWEFDTPMTERFDRLSNLDVTSDFSAAGAVVPTAPVGGITGRDFPSALIHSDPKLIQPRIGLAWRPIPGSSLVVRAGYGVYRNTNTYQSLALLLAQQPPFSKALSLESTITELLTLENGFVGSPSDTLNTYAIDPDFRVSFAQNWQVSAQRDLPASLTILATYLGSAGSNLPQAFLPNTFAPGLPNPCPACPIGYTYLISDGTSLRNAGSLEIRRRLRSGLTSTFRYTLAKATDDAAAYGTSGINGVAVAQDWQNLEGERAPSNFDQRHLVVAQVQYTTGVSVAGGALLTGKTGAFVKGWTMSAQLNTGSGLPSTPLYLTALRGTGVTGTVRGSLTGADPEETAEGSYANPTAYTAPATGSWGDAGRNSITGPRTFSLNAGVTRTFQMSNRVSLDWRIDATNLLNQVTFSSINTTVGSPQFGLPNRANTMRKIQSTFRFRF